MTLEQLCAARDEIIMNDSLSEESKTVAYALIEAALEQIIIIDTRRSH
jgi:hypothetical protein